MVKNQEEQEQAKQKQEKEKQKQEKQKQEKPTKIRFVQLYTVVHQLNNTV